MDVRALILEACDRALISQAELARRAGSSPSALSAWLTGRVSPTVASLTRVLAAADLQVRATLEPLLADLDARVDEVLAAVPVVDVRALEAFVAKVPVEHRWPVEGEDGSLTYCTGPISWAFDGATALALHGLAFSQDALSICMAWDDATRSWLTRGLMTSTVVSRQSFWGMDLELAERYLGAGPLVGAARHVQHPPCGAAADRGAGAAGRRSAVPACGVAGRGRGGASCPRRGARTPEVPARRYSRLNR